LQVSHGGYADSGEGGSRPGSRLKQNIDDLDNLLYDLNSAKKTTTATSNEADYTVSSAASTDYAYNEGRQGHVRKTATDFDDKSRFEEPEPPPKRNVAPWKPPAQQPMSASAFASKSAYESKMSSSSYAAASTDVYDDQRQYYAKVHSANKMTRATSPLEAKQETPKSVDHLLEDLRAQHEPDATGQPYRAASPPEKASKAAPPVYYPPEFKAATAQSKASTVPSKDSKDSGKILKQIPADDDDKKQGAAVVPICLPLCCAAPCVIM